ncbi:MAG: tetratricopeptide repeat protein [Candidatus Omnitrophica bacterium]|nr:tetratricopeptide repeat protein [Candidatus Omnitrophota bacterium]MBU2251525.1 tetratricopeptide repeat protein [Candidatus Omnitrophota bacterium]MBU2473787.1 tetratricopeptide repeat protein [Candidatus Omnitrophota bacterium]
MLKLELMRIFLISLLLIFPIFVSQATDSYAATTVKGEARVYRDEGYRLQSMGDLKGALAYYQKAVQMDPYYAEARNDLGVVYEALGEDDQALREYEEVIKIDPNYLAAYTNLAFLYEKKGDVKNATEYWKKRYLLGQAGDYWWEVSRQHLLKLGTYPEVRKEMLEERAARLSREFIYKREQERLRLVEEAKLHFDIGSRALKQGDAEVAVAEFRTVLSLDPPDEELKKQAGRLYQEAERLYLRKKAYSDTKSALEFIAKDDYLSAGEKLKDALDSVFRVAQ